VFVLDTSVASGLLAKHDQQTVDWVLSVPGHRLFLAAPVVYELLRGVLRLPDGARRRRVELAWTDETEPLFRGRILPLDATAASLWARVTVDAERRGLTPPVLDGQIAAIAMANGMTVVTRDQRGFGALGCKLLFLR
jgi:predicted nucleic acid-binding protein